MHGAQRIPRVRRVLEHPIDRVPPLVVRTLDAPRTALRRFDEHCATVAADVVEDADHAVMAPGNDERHACQRNAHPLRRHERLGLCGEPRLADERLARKTTTTRRHILQQRAIHVPESIGAVPATREPVQSG